MANEIRKPVPKNQRQLSIQQQDPLLENPNNAVTPLPQFQNNPNPATDKAFRGNEISLRGDTTKPFNVGIQDIDESIYYYFENIIKPQVYQNGAMIDIPIVYGNQERWKAVQKDGYYRDKNGKIMAPIIMFKRTSLEKNRSIGNKLDANNPNNYAVVATGYQKNNTYSHFDLLNNRKPVESYQVVVIPDYVTLQYDCIIWTYYIEQMNKIVESVNYASDSYWGDPARFKFLARIDNFTNNETLSQGEERLIKTNFSIKLNGYIIPEVINHDLAAIKKFYSKGKVTVSTEIEITPAGPVRFSEGGTPPPTPSFDADYQAILDYATTQGYTLPSAGQQTLQNQLVVDLKTAGIWSKLDTFAVFATDGDNDFALIDWKRLTDYTAVNSPTFTSNQGFTSNGTSSYILSNFFPLTNAINYGLNNSSFGVYQTQNDNIEFNAHGIYASNNSAIFLNPGQGPGGPIRSSNNVNSGVSTGNVSDRNGLTSTIRTSSTNVNHYRDSSLVASYSRTTTALPSNNVVLLASGDPTTVNYFCTDTLHSNYLGSALTTTEHSDFYAALNTYKNAL